MTLLAATEETIQALRDSGRIEAVDAALIEAARLMAAELDVHPYKAMLWKEFQSVIERLRGNDTGGTELADLLTGLRDAPTT